MLLDYQAIVAAAHRARVESGENHVRVSCKSVILACLPGTDVRSSRKLPPELVAVATLDQEPEKEPARSIAYNGAIKDPAAHRVGIAQAIGHLLLHAAEAPELRFEVPTCGGTAHEIQRQGRHEREAMLFALELLLPLNLLDRFFGAAPLFPKGDEPEAEFDGRVFSAAGRFVLPVWVIRNRLRMLQVHRRTGWAVSPRKGARLSVMNGGRGR